LLDFVFGPYHQPRCFSEIGYDDVHAAIIRHHGLKANALLVHDTFNEV
jgi:hypothetical protein